MSENDLLKEKVESLEKRVKFLEDTFATLSDISLSAEAGEYIAKRQRALSVAKLVKAAAGDKSFDIEAQQHEVDRLTAEKKAADARIEAALAANDYSVDMDESLISQFAFSQVNGGIVITSFAGFDGIEEIAVPQTIQGQTVIAIGYKAFENVKVNRISLPSTILSIGESAFSGCRQLSSINIPSVIKSIDKSAFNYCAALTEVDIPREIASLGVYCFSRSGLQQVSIPGSIKEIPQGCFNSCPSLMSVILNEGIQRIGYQAFADSPISKIIIPESVKEIYGNAFEFDSRYKHGEVRSAFHMAFLGDMTDVRMSTYEQFPPKTTVYCKPGSAIQKTARLHGATIKPLSDFKSA